MNKVQLASPWENFYHEIDALFKNDPDVKVKFDEENNVVQLFVDNQEKADALTQILPTERTFGNVTVYVEVLPADKTNNVADLFQAAFKGNPAIAYIKTIEVFGAPMTYVLFKKEVVQYYNDDLSDIHGNRSTLYQDIAKDIFDEAGIFFCTDY